MTPITPQDSRYIPFTQQQNCCVPTAISMIMYRHKIPLIPLEELAYHLGFIVPPKDRHLFYSPRVSKRAPKYGYGTQIQNPSYDPNKAFSNLNIPLTFQIITPDQIQTADNFLTTLQDILDHDQDAILCYDHNRLQNRRLARLAGHVVIFDQIIDGKIRIIDPAHTRPKWQTYTPNRLFTAISHHAKFSGGIWLLEQK